MDQIAERKRENEASLNGASARRRGDWSNSNPYLARDMMPHASGQAHHVWFAECDAWWRGWDHQDAAIRAP